MTPTACPTYVAMTQEIGHACQSLSQSKGKTIAPIHAPESAQTA